MYLYTKNDVAGLRHAKLLMMDEMCMVNEKNTKIALKVKGQRSRSNVTSLPTTSSVHHEAYSYQVTSISD